MSDRDGGRSAGDRARPRFPKRAVITGGMPYGNKDLHFGHVGGVFVPADMFARFLRDRIGPENVIFVSGTDCYGSPIVEDHRKLAERGEFQGDLEAFVRYNHERQRATLAAYGISLDAFAASGLGRYREIHQEMGAWILEALHAHGHLEKRTTPQWYDAERGTFLNGRQVVGRCPVQGCRSENAYADECSLGHQYEFKDLINPRSTLTGRRPEMRDVTNWYLKTGEFRDTLLPWYECLRETGEWRPFAVSSVLEYFEPPTIHVTRDQMEALQEALPALPPHELREGQSQSVQIIFERLEAMEAARAVLGERGIRYRVGKTLVPFRLTGNLEWGLPAPEIDGLARLTFWVWPESLWAPISFTAAYLEQQGKQKETWREWWCSDDATVYQFIGEDNVYFYGLAQMAMFLGVQPGDPVTDPPEGELRLTRIVANRHLLFLDKKASSSSAVKPPMANDLLSFYTADQLRAHFLSLGLGTRSVSFRPKPLNPSADPRDADPVLKEGNLLSNAFNRAVRSCFYTAQKYFEGKLPRGEVSPDVRERSEAAILDYEAAMAALEFHRAVEVAGDLIREINSRWTRSNPYSEECDPEVRRQALVDAFQMVRVAAVLVHPVAPEGTERIREYLQVGEELWHWERLFEPLLALVPDPADHALKFLEPRTDFFEKPPSQT
ncbi:MAG: class I tRNA ligase family protein [Armatimonadetes bacterium]|nr:class I tRNA ligase family protein [Armatimonadota bacterium]